MEWSKVLEILERRTTIPNDGESFDEIEEAFRMAEEAVRKQIPAIPVSDGLSVFAPGLARHFKDTITCPNCHHEINTDKKGNIHQQCCDNCGQALSETFKSIYE